MHAHLTFSTLVFCALAATAQAQDIPNGGFEQWTNQGNYIDPAGWLTSNMVSYSIDGSLTCEQGSPGVVGNYFVKVTDRQLSGTGMQQASITIGVPGVVPGFPYTGRPDALNGFWQYHPQLGGHDGLVNAALTRWNTATHQREVIANAPIHISSETGNWQSFNSPFLYYSDLDPDSAIVSIQATSAVAGDGTSIWVDNLSFGPTVLVDDIAAPGLPDLFPSPATDQLNITAPGNATDVVIEDLTGRVWCHANLVRQKATVDVSKLPAGVFLARVRWNNGRLATRMFVKQ